MFAMYLRKSRSDYDEEARGAGETLSRHRAQLFDLARRHGVVVGEIYSEIVSGDTLNARPEMLRLLDDVSAGKWDGVLCMAIDRLGRGDSIDQGVILRAFELSHTKIITPAHIYDFDNGSYDAENAEMQQFLARFELKAIKRRMWAGRCQSVKEGKWVSPRAPFGYKRVQLPAGQKGWTLEIVPEHAEAVRMAFELYAHGRDGKRIGGRAIASMLNSMGMPTFSGTEWTSTSIKNMLKNPVYIGKIQWCRRKSVRTMEGGQMVTSRPLSQEVSIVDGLHPAIIDQQLWDDVQAILSNNKAFPRTNTGTRLSNPLAGIVFCSVCGRAMYYKDATKAPWKPFIVCKYPRCPTHGVHFEIVEGAILSTLRDWLSLADRPADDVQRVPSVDPIAVQRRALEDQLKKLAAQKDTIMDLLEQGVYTLPEYQRRVSIVTDKQAQAEQALADLPAPLPNPLDSIRPLVPQIRHVLDAYPLADNADEKNALLKSVISRVIYSKTVTCYRNQNPADFLTLDVWPVSCE